MSDLPNIILQIRAIQSLNMLQLYSATKLLCVTVKIYLDAPMQVKLMNSSVRLNFDCTSKKCKHRALIYYLNVTKLVSVRITFLKHIIQYQCNENS